MQVIDYKISNITVEKRQRRPEANIENLVASIKDVGLLHPIVVGSDGRLKVGFRRLTAYQRMGRPTIPTHVTDNLDDVYAALRAERDENIQREALPPSLIVAHARELEEEERKLAESRMITGNNQYTEPWEKFSQGSVGRATDKVAAAFGISRVTYERAKQIVGTAADDPETFGDLPTLMDKKSVNAAFKEIRKRNTAKERKVMAESAAQTPKDKRWNVYHGDVETVELARRYDYIITDPPYPRKYLPLYEVLAQRANEWLKDGGLLLVMCGQSYLDEIYQMMSKHLTYYWTAAYLTPGQPTPLRQRQVNTTWKPILIFARNDYHGKIFGDVFRSDGNDKDFHKWGQSVSGMLSIVSQVCLPGQYILDPFCGAGTTGVATLMHGCLFDGLDNDQQNVDITRFRLGEL